MNKRFLKHLLPLLSVLMILCPLECSINGVVTYTFSGGRFGDNLLAYMHAKWISYSYDLELLYKPFPYSDQLKIDLLEKQYSSALIRKYKKTVSLGRSKKVKLMSRVPVLYVVPYFPESAWERSHCKDGNGKRWPYISVDWNDTGFKSLLKEMIAPINPLKKLAIPLGRISVAVHLRKGGGFDSAETPLHFPLKFPPNAFFIRSLNNLWKTVQERPLYVYLFTDDKNPSALREEFAQAFEGKDILFDCRDMENDHNSNVLEDFFALTQFDCFIHGESNFAVCASKIADYAIEIEPSDFHVKSKKVVIDKINTRIHEKRLKQIVG